MKLYYFDGAGRAESIRLLLTHAGIPFEDVRIKYEDWNKHKDKFELKQLPVLEENGKSFNQSYAILEYLGAKLGYLPKSHEKLYSVIFIMNTVEDWSNKAYLTISPLTTAESKKIFEDSEHKLFMGAIEKRLLANKTQDFLVGSKYTIADFYVLGVYANVLQDPSWNQAFAKKIEVDFPKLFAYLNKRMLDFNIYYKKSKLQLYYFDIPGRAEMIRMMLKYLKVPFEDVRFSFPEWLQTKNSGKYELHQVPIMIDEPSKLSLCQSDAIMHLFGSKYGLLPIENPERLYFVIWICNSMKDMIEKCAEFLFTQIPPEKKAEIRSNYFTKLIPTYFAAIESKIKFTELDPFLVGHSYTIADFYTIGFWRGWVISPMLPEFKKIAEGFPKYSSYCEWHTKLL